MAGKFEFRLTWVIDSRAIKHVACPELTSSNLKHQKERIPVSIPNDDKVSDQGIGVTQLPTNMKINYVLYIPNFIFNLLSVIKITRYFNCFMTLFSKFYQGLHVGF